MSPATILTSFPRISMVKYNNVYVVKFIHQPHIANDTIKPFFHRYLPPNSYIEASVLGQQLTAQKMYEAIQNRTKYYEYFSWRNHYAMKESPILNACTLCQFMNHEGWLKHSSSYKTFRKWWNPFYQELCGLSQYL